MQIKMIFEAFLFKIKYFWPFAVNATHIQKKLHQALKAKYLLYTLLATSLIISCSRSKNTFTSRTYHEMVSRYNVLFNGEQSFRKGVEMLSQQHQDNFDEILPVFRYGDASMVGTVKPKMDKAIEKSIKAIKRHSMMIQGEQRNDYIDDAYLLMGKSRYFNRQYIEALETLNYAIQHFPKSESANEAKLWAAKTEIAMGNYFNAKERLEKLYRNSDLDKELRAQAYASYAQLQIEQGNESAAFQLLSQAVDRTHDKQMEIRWLYIMGQLQSKLGNDYDASNLFLKVIKKGPPYQLLFNAQLNRARNYDTDLQDPDKVYSELRAMLADEKNFDNRDQIYYVMAEVAERMDDEEQMLEYLRQSIRASTKNPNQMGLSYLKIAEYNFDERNYPAAASYYDSSYSKLTQGHPRYEEVKTKAESLSGLVTNLREIALQDSLLKLASLNEKDLRKKVRDIIRAEEDAKRREEMRNDPLTNGGSPAVNQGGSGGQWYFYNPSVRVAGMREFVNSWGNRKLEDQWRRKNKELTAGLNGGGNSPDQNEQESGSQGMDQKIEEYISRVPSTEPELELSNNKIIEAYLAISAIYRNELKDLEAAEKQLKELTGRYKDFEQQGRAWYSLYRVNLKLEDQADVDLYKQKILSALPDSEFAALIQGQQPSEVSSSTAARNYYQKAYRTYAEHEYRQALRMVDSGITAFDKNIQHAQFLLLKSFIQGELGRDKAMKESLTELAGKFAGTPQGQRAQDLLDKMKQWEAEAEQEGKSGEEAQKTQTAKSKYEAKPNEEQKYVALVPNRKGLVNEVNIKINDFNKKFFGNLKLNVKSIYISAEEQMVMVSGLPNQRKAQEYFSLINQRKLLQESVGSTNPKHFVISNGDFTLLYRDKDFEGYLKYYRENLKK